MKPDAKENILCDSIYIKSQKQKKLICSVLYQDSVWGRQEQGSDKKGRRRENPGWGAVHIIFLDWVLVCSMCGNSSSCMHILICVLFCV